VARAGSPPEHANGAPDANAASDAAADFNNPLKQLDTNMLALFVEFSLGERIDASSSTSMDEIPSMSSWAEHAEVAAANTPRPELVRGAAGAGRRSTAAVLAAISELPASGPTRVTFSEATVVEQVPAGARATGSEFATVASQVAGPAQGEVAGPAEEADDADLAPPRRLRQRAFAAIALGIAGGASLVSWVWWQKDLESARDEVARVAAVATQAPLAGPTPPPAAPAAEPARPSPGAPAPEPSAPGEPVAATASAEPTTAPAPKPEPVAQAERAAPVPAPTPVSQAEKPTPAPEPKPLAEAKEPPPAPKPEPKPEAVGAAPTGDPTACRASVNTKPPGVEIWLGDRNLGTTPAASLGIPCGGLTLALRHPRYAEAQIDVTATAGQIAEVSRKLDRPSAKLQVTSDPPGADVITRGKVRGRTPFELSVLQYEGVQIEVRLDGHAPWQKQLRPSTPELTVHAELKRQ
jgi:outer membrane biosynthesis protein TonB